MPNIAGEPRLHEDGVARTIADLVAIKPSIRRMITVCQHADGSISYVREAADTDDYDVLAFIGMLDFAKMGFFAQMQDGNLEDASNVDENGLEDTSWIDDDATS